MKSNNIIKIIPQYVDNIWNYNVITNIYKYSNSSVESKFCNLYELLNIMTSKDELVYNISPEYYQQILFIQFYDVNMNSVLEFAMNNNLTPTFVLNGYNYNYYNELCSGEEFTFVYFLNEPITNQTLIDSIYRYLKTIFQPYLHLGEVGSYESIDMTDVDIINNFTNIIISHNIYIPVKEAFNYEL